MKDIIYILEYYQYKNYYSVVDYSVHNKNNYFEIRLISNNLVIYSNIWTISFNPKKCLVLYLLNIQNKERF